MNPLSLTVHSFATMHPDRLQSLIMSWPLVAHFPFSRDDTQLPGHLPCTLHTDLCHKAVCIHAPLSSLDDHMKVMWCATHCTQRSGWKELWQLHEVSIVSFILLSFFYITFYDSFIVLFICSLFMSLCTCPMPPDLFIGSMFFVPQMCLPVLYKYWPLPTCIFSSLIIISISLVTPVLSTNSLRTLSSFKLELLHQLHLGHCLLQAPTDLQLITTQHWLIIWLTSYAPEFIFPCLESSFQLSVHTFYLVTALTKHSEAWPPWWCDTFGPLWLWHIGFGSHPQLFGVSHPDFWKSI